MFARTVAILTAMALAPAVAAAQDAQASAPATDPAIVEGKIDSLAEQYAETKVDVAGIKKLKFSGYLQARYAWQEAVIYGKATGTPPVFGTPPDKDNFYIRRGRFKVVADADLTQFVLQIDALPSSLGLKEAYVTVKLPAAWAVDAGLQLHGHVGLLEAQARRDGVDLERVLGQVGVGHHLEAAAADVEVVLVGRRPEDGRRPGGLPCMTASCQA